MPLQFDSQWLAFVYNQKENTKNFCNLLHRIVWRGMEGAWNPEQLIMKIDASCSSLELLIDSLKKKRKTCTSLLSFRSLLLPHNCEEQKHVFGKSLISHQFRILTILWLSENKMLFLSCTSGTFVGLETQASDNQLNWDETKNKILDCFIPFQINSMVIAACPGIQRKSTHASTCRSTWRDLLGV